MVLETAQLLSTAHANFGEAVYSDARNFFEVRGQRVYHPTHQNHPCACRISGSTTPRMTSANL